MRIIDKQHDFYDYLQDPTDTIVFDRRDSFLLTKEDFCQKISVQRYWNDSKHRFVLMQCGAAHWLFLVTIEEYKANSMPAAYHMELLQTWKNYDRPNALIELHLITFNLHLYNYQLRDIDVDYVRAHVDDLVDAINHGDYKEDQNIGNNTKFTEHKGRYIKETQNLPILKACGIAELVDPVSIFCAIEEHFSREKTASESTEPKGATNEDKVVMHGFDTKTSFRNVK